ncbi:AlpA family transcriptional regulator [Aeromonas veronii]|uniref:helix-turn-helix transcriptional regulator n=1 Tax=Aeromonas TaxID=642 RepID=UPI000C2921E9|nr:MULTISPECIES: AlpA family phage regulatory protein [Aeromonas]ATY80808.1 AlpA family transcriptional regulator [Aeromonas veronii]WRK93292.1 AlpA family phage regulatory protein [Aeromonas hydrophila]HDO1327304.1 AlpA family phage regulatory protein [Aeromonas veronii]
MTTSVIKPDRILRMPEMKLRVGMSRSWIYERINPKSPRFDPSFPRPVRVGTSAIGWRESSVDIWIQSLNN